MQFFVDYLVETATLQRTLIRISENKHHQGTTIRFTDEFLWFLRLRRTVDPNILRRIFRDFAEGYVNSFYWFQRYGVNAFGWGDENLIAPKLDYNEFRKAVEEFTRLLDVPGLKPILITLCVFNDADIGEFQESMNDYTSEFRFSNEIRFAIEQRNRNILYSSRDKHIPVIGGVSIGKVNDDSFGTLGGLLESKDGDVYGLTCAHVAQNGDNVVQPAMVEKGTNESIGSVIHSGPVNWSQHCDEHQGEKCYDISLIEIKYRKHLQSIYNLGPVRRYRTFRDLRFGMKVEFNGRTTNKRKVLYVGSLCLSYKVGIDVRHEMRYACFNNLIELRPKPFKLFGMIYLPDGEPVLPGDSGAWVCSNDRTGYSWCGMIMSGDIDRGYFIGAEDILNYLSKQGFNFTINPI